MPGRPTVFVIEHNAGDLMKFKAALHSVRLPTETFDSARRFLAEVQPDEPGCVVLELRLPGMSGLELQQRLAAQTVAPPLVFVTAHGDIPMAVEALRGGAIDFLEKPFRPQLLIDRVFEALEVDAEQRRQQAILGALLNRELTLTPREQEVMGHVVRGLSNREAAEELGVSRKAVEAYRARVMRKMEAKNLPELVRFSVILEQSRLPHRRPDDHQEPQVRSGKFRSLA